MTDEEAVAAIRRIRRQRSKLAFSSSLAVVGIAALFIALWMAIVTSNKNEEAAAKFSIGLDQVNSALKAVCEKTGDKTGLPAEVREDCLRAESGQKPPVVEETPPPAVAEINIDTLYSAVRTVVAAELAANPPKEGKPGEAPPPEEIVQKVKEVYLANKPADGKTPTDAELLALIRRVYNENPPQDGVDGKDATQAQVDAAIAAYCSREGEPCRSQNEGPEGPAGPSPVSTSFVREGDSCFFVVVYSTGPAMRAQVPEEGEVSLCGPPESEPTEIPPTTTTG
jgi:hypothetical protein